LQGYKKHYPLGPVCYLLGSERLTFDALANYETLSLCKDGA